MGIIRDGSHVQKFGGNTLVGTGAFEGIWGTGGTFNWLTAAAAVRIKTGGNAADAAAGLGARSVMVEGLDENFNLASELLVTNGVAMSDPTVVTFIRVFRAYVVDSGAYGAANTGVIVVETTGGTTMLTIAVETGQSQYGAYTVPAGKIAAVPRYRIFVDSGKNADVQFCQRSGADVVLAPFSAPRRVANFIALAGESQIQLTTWHIFNEKTDIFWQAKANTTAAAVEVSFDVRLENGTL